MDGAKFLYVGTAQGALVLERQGKGGWEVMHQGLRGWSVSQVTASPELPARIVAGTRGDGVWVSEDRGKTWRKPNYGKRGPGKVRCVTIDARDPETFYAGNEPIDIFVSRDAGSNWTCLESVRDVPSVASTGYPVDFIEPHVRVIVQDPAKPATLYAALQVGYFLKSTDGGSTWRLMSGGIDEDVHALAINPRNPRQIFAATGGEGARQGRAKGRALYQSEDAGETWTPTALNFPHYYGLPLALHPQHPNVVYAGMASGDPRDWSRPTGAESVVAQTQDGGKTWKQVDGGLAETSKTCPSAIVFDPENPANIYIGFQNGDLFASENGGESWAKVPLKLPPIASIVCSPV